MAHSEEEHVKFRQMLLRVQESLRADDLQDLMFLCSDHLTTRELDTVSSATELFTHLETKEKLSANNLSLLLELLTIIKQHSLIRKLGLDESAVDNGSTDQQISPYRRLLFDMSQSITDEDLKKIKFMLRGRLPERKLDQNTTLLQLFSELEKKDLLDENKVDNLQEMIKYVYPALERKIILYKTEREMFIAQETQETENNSFLWNIPVQPSSLSSRSSLSSVDMMTRDQLDRLSLHEASGVSEDQSQRLDTSLVTENERPNSPVTEDLEIPQYEMKGVKRGICLIFNNYNFSGGFRVREGTDIDKGFNNTNTLVITTHVSLHHGVDINRARVCTESLSTVFQWLGFEVWTERDCDKKRTLEVLKNLASRDHTQADCVVCCVLSHGDVDAIIASDGQKVTLKELMSPLYPPQCPSLIHKPKLFFIQACRGTKEQRAVWPQNNTSDDVTMASDAMVPRDSIPESADFLLAMSTVRDYASFREKDKGTWFIQALCHNLKLLVPRGVDLLSILTRVNHEVSQKSDSSGKRKQMPQPEFTLTKRVVFPIPETHPPQSTHQHT